MRGENKINTEPSLDRSPVNIYSRYLEKQTGLLKIVILFLCKSIGNILFCRVDVYLTGGNFNQPWAEDIIMTTNTAVSLVHLLSRDLVLGSYWSNQSTPL